MKYDAVKIFLGIGLENTILPYVTLILKPFNARKNSLWYCNAFRMIHIIKEKKKRKEKQVASYQF